MSQVAILDGGEPVPDAVRDAVMRRAAMRQSGNFTKADAVRLELRQLGWNIQDTKRGVRVRKLDSWEAV